MSLWETRLLINKCFYVFAGLKETTEQLVKKKLEGKDKLTPWEEFLEKKKDRKKQKKSQRQVSNKTKSPTEVTTSDPSII